MVGTARRRTGKTRALALWMNGLRVGTWRLPARGPSELHYDPAWAQAPEGRPLSLSLPLSHDLRPRTGPVVDAFFDNLLPDSDAIRRRLAARFGADTSAFSLLAALGRDCAGAVQLLPEDATPAPVDRIEAEPLSDAAVAALLRRSTAPARRFADDEDALRISLAGAQEKTALLRHRGRWMLPLHTTPTTHILKLPLGLVGNRRADMRSSVYNEWLCMRILAAYGLPVAACEIAHFEDQTVLVVQRFDRQLHSSRRWWLRLPQEDFCQALGAPPTLKYEADGGPGVLDIARILRQSERAPQDLATLLASQLLFWLLAATDGHAKNFSLQLLPQGRYQLTPLYDVVSAWPVVGKGAQQYAEQKLKLAMALPGNSGKHYALRSIQRRHFNAIAPRVLLQGSAEAIIEAVVAATPGVVDTVARDLPQGFPAKVAESILGGLERSVRRLQKMPAT